MTETYLLLHMGQNLIGRDFAVSLKELSCRCWDCLNFFRKPRIYVSYSCDVRRFLLVSAHRCGDVNWAVSVGLGAGNLCVDGFFKMLDPAHSCEGSGAWKSHPLCTT